MTSTPVHAKVRRAMIAWLGAAALALVVLGVAAQEYPNDLLKLAKARPGALYPNGATAMREMAADADPGAIGCTQITEIKYTPGIELVGPLPNPFGLATIYTAAIAARAAQTELAQRFIERLCGPDSRASRVDGGFEFD